MRTTASTPTRGPMRHIPEDELHAYLDQGAESARSASRSKVISPDCSILPGEPRRHRRAAGPNHGPAGASRAAPEHPALVREPAAVVPTEEASAPAPAHVRRWRGPRAWWPRSGLGWMRELPFSRTRRNIGSPPRCRFHSRCAVSPMRRWTRIGPVHAGARASPSRSQARRRRARPPSVTAVRSGRGAARRPQDSIRAAMLAVLDPAPAVELSQLDSSPAGTSASSAVCGDTCRGMGRRRRRVKRLPHIDGLPVLQVQVQSGDQGQRPVMVVAQQLTSGEVIRTIEGLGHRRVAAPGPPVDGRRGLAAAPRRHGRTPAITATTPWPCTWAATACSPSPATLPSDSLRAMIRRTERGDEKQVETKKRKRGRESVSGKQNTVNEEYSRSPFCCSR